MEHLILETFKEKIMDFETNKETWNFEGTKPAILKFTADWCAPCKAIQPILDELAKEYEDKVDFYKIDTEDQQELSMMFGIRSIPSMLFIPKDGQPQMATGMMSKDKLKEVIEDILL